MDATSVSLLDRLREEPSDVSWARLVDLYSPLIRNWLGRNALFGQDADDQVQEVLLVVFRKLPEFRREPHVGAFRRWLKGITVNCLRRFWRARKARPAATGADDSLAMLDNLEDATSELSLLWDREHDQHVTKQLLTMIENEFEARTWAAFRRVTFDGVPAADVAAELGISANAVFIAKSRVLSRLRQVGDGLLD